MRFGIRVDSNSAIGLGHFKRCVTLAKELVDQGYQVTFLMLEVPDLVNRDIEMLGANLHVLQNEENDVLSWLKESCLPHLIVDHYQIDYRWHQKVRPFVASIGVIDDLANRKLDCDWLLDQNFYIEPYDRYDGLIPVKCNTLLGPSFALLREEFNGKFLANRKSRSSIKQFKVLVFFGGGDQTDICVEAMQALLDSDIHQLEVIVVISSLNPRRSIIRTLADKHNSIFSCREDVNNISDLMVWADLSIGAGGSISLERCFVGLPSLVFVVAENQLETTKAYAKIGAIDYLGVYGSESKRLLTDRLNYYYENSLELGKMKKSCRTVFEEGRCGAVNAVDMISIMLTSNNRG